MRLVVIKELMLKRVTLTEVDEKLNLPGTKDFKIDEDNEDHGGNYLDD